MIPLSLSLSLSHSLTLPHSLSLSLSLILSFPIILFQYVYLFTSSFYPIFLLEILIAHKLFYPFHSNSLSLSFFFLFAVEFFLHKRCWSTCAKAWIRRSAFPMKQHFVGKAFFRLLASTDATTDDRRRPPPPPPPSRKEQQEFWKKKFHLESVCGCKKEPWQFPGKSLPPLASPVTKIIITREWC